MVESFPMTAAAARGLKETNWQARLFVPHKEDGTYLFPIPKNIIEFKDNLMMITILKIADILGYEIIDSEEELPTQVLKTDKAGYFAGYTAAANEQVLGARIKPSGQWERGYLCKQTEAILADVGNRNAHIRRVEHNPGKILSDMGGFTKKYWGLRGDLATLFKSLPTPKVDDDSKYTYMLSGGELVGKIIRKKLPYENGGIFRKEELQYLNRYYSIPKSCLEKIQRNSQKPTKEFFDSFWTELNKITEDSKLIEKELGTLYASRAKYLFRTGSKKKTDIQWSKKPLDAKLEEMSKEHFIEYFSPKNLPGFPRVIATEANANDPSFENYITQKWKLQRDGDLYAEKLAIVSAYENGLLTFSPENANEHN